MGQLLLVLVGALVVAAIVFGAASLITGSDPGLDEAVPDGRAVPLPAERPLTESDVAAARFDTALRGYRMAQVDAVLRRAAYDIGYKEELIAVLEAEVTALRAGEQTQADELREIRLAALGAAHRDAGPPTFQPPAADADAGTEADAEAAEAADAEAAAEAEADAEADAGATGKDGGSDGPSLTKPAQLSTR